MKDILESIAVNMLDLPFKHRGRTVDGIDCYGLVRLIYKEFYKIDLPLLAVTDGARANIDHAVKVIVDESASSWIVIPPGMERPGHLIILRRLGHPLHLGVVLTRKRMVHADEPGVMIESYDGPKWRHRIIGFFRHVEAPYVG